MPYRAENHSAGSGKPCRLRLWRCSVLVQRHRDVLSGNDLPLSVSSDPCVGPDKSAFLVIAESHALPATSGATTGSEAEVFVCHARALGRSEE
jgi:hypothetical protein